MGRARAAGGSPRGWFAVPAASSSSQSFVLILRAAGPFPCCAGGRWGWGWLWGRGMLSGSGAVRPGFGPPLFFGSASSSFVPPGVCSWRGGFGGLVRFVGGCGRVGCELHSGREHQESFLLLFWFAAPRRAPFFVLPFSFVCRGGGGWGAGVASARGAPVIRWAVSAPVSVIVVCCVLFVDI